MREQEITTRLIQLEWAETGKIASSGVEALRTDVNMEQDDVTKIIKYLTHRGFFKKGIFEQLARIITQLQAVQKRFKEKTVKTAEDLARVEKEIQAMRHDLDAVLRLVDQEVKNAEHLSDLLKNDEIIEYTLLEKLGDRYDQRVNERVKKIRAAIKEAATSETHPLDTLTVRLIKRLRDAREVIGRELSGFDAMHPRDKLSTLRSALDVMVFQHNDLMLTVAKIIEDAKNMDKFLQLEKKDIRLLTQYLESGLKIFPDSESTFKG